MFTVCPKCTLTLVVTTVDLRAGQGYVRCGRCANVFNALIALREGEPGGSTSDTAKRRLLETEPETIDRARAGIRRRDGARTGARDLNLNLSRNPSLNRPDRLREDEEESLEFDAAATDVIGDLHLSARGRTRHRLGHLRRGRAAEGTAARAEPEPEPEPEPMNPKRLPEARVLLAHATPIAAERVVVARRPARRRRIDHRRVAADSGRGSSRDASRNDQCARSALGRRNVRGSRGRR